MLGPSIYFKKKKRLFWYFSETNFQNTFWIWQDYWSPQKHVLIYSNIYTNLVSSITKEILIWLEKKILQLHLHNVHQSLEGRSLLITIRPLASQRPRS